MSTTEYLDKLTIDQLRFARDEADRRIKAAESKPKKIVWSVNGGLTFGKVFREEDWAKAKTFLLSEYDKSFDSRLVDEILGRDIKPAELKRYVPSLDFTYENEVEYEEWFK
jgi:hypothetical protein